MSGETKWSPGAYRVTHDGANTYRSEVVTTSPRGKTVVLARIPTPNRSPEQANANATLFAEAKNLYSALEACLEGGVFKHPQVRERALAAMARARGEEANDGR